METTDSSSQPEEIQFSFSYFNNLWSKESAVITLKDLYLQETSALWRPKTESYRKLKNRPDRENEAKMTKESMPVVIVEGVCRPHCSHAAANLDKMSGLAMYDMDHCRQRTSEIKALMRHLPYVAYAHNSISGEGLKIIVHLDVRTPEEYPLAYAICQQTLENIAGHPCDEQCARITQPCSCVWDSDAYYNPAPQPYPWREELVADPSLAQLIPAYGHNPAKTSTSYVYIPGASESTKISPIPPATEACGYIEAFVRTFAQYTPWQKGNRHESMLALGRSARRKGFSREELEKLTSVMTVKIVGDGYTLQELKKDLASGYQYVDLSYAPQKEASLLSALSTVTYTPVSVDVEAEKKEAVSIKNEELRASSPCIPDEVYARLPNFLKEALKPARNKRERDILLLGVLANLSGCMPLVRITFDQRPNSPHLYILVIAPPASGKGLLALAGRLPQAIENYLKGENKRKKEAYERELKAWEQEQGHKFRQKQEQQPAEKAPATMPEEPEYYHLCGAAYTSKNQIVARLKTNGDLGLIINATELDTISGSMKQDYGKHDDVFRAAFHHEPVATDFKVDRQMICAEEPRLALCLSGTPNQLPIFIHSTDDGGYSRFAPYICEANWKYRSAAPIKGQEDYVSLYKRLSREVLDMFLFFQQSPTEVTLTDSQWEEHTAYFDRVLNEVASEQTDAPGAIVLRSALIAARIASIFTALRKFECAMQMKEYICTDDDFHSAMQIAQVTLNHSLLLSSSLPGNESKAKPLQSYFRIRPIIESLPKIFTYKEIKQKALSAGISESSICRYLKELVRLKQLDKQENKYIKIKTYPAKQV